MNAMINDTPTSLPALCPEATSTGLNLPARLSYDRWQAIGRALAHGAGRLQWYVGDWWASGEHKYGERYKAAEELPLSAHTCESYASVAHAFRETSRRMEVLSFRHHQIVSGLPPEEADELLAWAAEPVAAGGKPHSTRALQERVARLPGITIRIRPPEVRVGSYYRQVQSHRGPVGDTVADHTA